MDIMVTKALGDFIPFLDPNKNLFLNLSYEKVISEANIMNYDYIADSYSFSFSKSFQLNKQQKMLKIYKKPKKMVKKYPFWLKNDFKHMIIYI